MSDTARTFTTAEFSRKTGIAVSTLTQMLRQGQLRGEKRSGKWAIFESELERQKTAAKTPPAASSEPPAIDRASDGRPGYDIATFARMTYLTEKGVRQYLRAGRLTGNTDSQGHVTVDSTNLERPEFRHLIR